MEQYTALAILQFLYYHYFKTLSLPYLQKFKIHEHPFLSNFKMGIIICNTFQTFNKMNLIRGDSPILNTSEKFSRKDN